MLSAASPNLQRTAPTDPVSAACQRQGRSASSPKLQRTAPTDPVSAACQRQGRSAASPKLQNGFDEGFELTQVTDFEQSVAVLCVFADD